MKITPEIIASKKHTWSDHKIQRAKFFPVSKTEVDALDAVTAAFRKSLGLPSPVSTSAPARPILPRTPTPEDNTVPSPRPVDPRLSQTQQLRYWLMPNPPTAVAEKRNQQQALREAPQQVAKPKQKSPLLALQREANALLQSARAAQSADDRLKLARSFPEKPLTDSADEELRCAIDALVEVEIEFAQQEAEQASQCLKQRTEALRRHIPKHQTTQQFANTLFPNDSEAVYALRSLIS